MSTLAVDGRTYARMLLNGAALLEEHAEEINAMNVFPVSDGDTGTNMARTMEGGLAEAGREGVPESISEASARFTRGALLSARGNSGVILSQIFAGINEKLANCEKATAAELAEAYRNGVSKAYAAVQNPTEGTILTVFRESTETAASKAANGATVEEFLESHIAEGRASLARTKDLLPVLAEAGVVDSGAAGYLYIAEGMFEALCGKETDFVLPGSQEKRQAAVDIDLFTRDSVLEFGYCTEFMLRLTTAKTDPDSFEVGTVTEQLTALGGESIVAYKTGDIIKIHVHTFTPGKILECAQKYGEFLTVKIENMSLGHSERIKPAKKPDNGKKYAVVAVASGEGMAALFREMGADAIVSGGQTSNPSTQDFVRAFGQCAAEDIIVLPNHKNIILAAEQAAKIYEGARVHVVESRSFMQGFGALSVLTPGITDIEALITSARNAAASVEGYQVTRAVRDAEINGAKVKNGEYIAIGDGGIAASAQTANEAVLAMLENADTDMCEIITLFAGADTSAEQRAELTARINELYPDLETVVYESGQEIYDYYVALE